jgi:D-alanyl-D-alanine carboxypeptidase
VATLDNAGLPKKPPKMLPPPQVDDIPVALRNTPAPRRRYRLKPLLIIGSAAGLIAIALGVVVAILITPKSPENSASTEPAVTSSPTASPSDADTLLGHFAYEEVPASELAPITPDGRLQMRKAAAKQYKAMAAAARANGVILVPISGFRSIAEQKHLFFDVKAQRGQDAKERAKVSAPPGHSEHHTGYAADIGDGNVPATNLSPTFEKTAAFKWLQANAARFSFEMSFPRNNPQGLNYEPWHWRFVGDPQSLETFYKAKESQKPTVTTGEPTPATGEK